MPQINWSGLIVFVFLLSILYRMVRMDLRRAEDRRRREMYEKHRNK